MSDSARTSTQQASTWLADFGAALERADPDAPLSLFEADSYWRDLVSFTWNITTLEGQDAIRAMLESTLAATKPSGWQIVGKASAAGGVTECWFTFETAVARGKGHLRLKGDRCWTLLTTMIELTGFEAQRGPTRERGVEHGAVPERKNWLERKAQAEAELGYTTQPYCVIIGGGQGGIGLGARLKRLGVPTLIIEKNNRPGDSWRNRYKSLCLHDPVWYDHLPYLPFPEDWPIFSPKDKIGDWLEMYTKVMELNYWSSSECLNASYDKAAKAWSVLVDRAGRRVRLRPKQLVLATGMSGFPEVPKFPGSDSFRGEQHHSSRHGSGEPYAGKPCVVIGSNNSAHDIAADLWE